jgi:hypothetical protein
VLGLVESGVGVQGIEFAPGQVMTSSLSECGISRVPAFED